MKFRALRTYREGGRKESRWIEESLENLDAGEVVIRTRYAAINYKDARAVRGVGSVITRYPCIPGIEMSGTVVSSSVPAFREGDKVTVGGGRVFGMGHDGGYSEVVRAPAEWVAKIPEGFDEHDVVGMGIAAYTAAVAVEAMQHHGVTPDKGPILVTGATGGGSSFAIDMLAGLGYSVVASTGKSDAADYLRAIGASEVIGRDDIAPGDRPLEDQRWAGVIDAVGGKPLDQALRTMKQKGVVCPYGNAAGESFTTSIYPFILRQVVLAGVNANHTVPQRGRAWARMARGGDLRPKHVDRICKTITFDELPAHCARLIEAGEVGRAVVKIAA